jgi:hypothetical protein
MAEPPEQPKDVVVGEIKWPTPAPIDTQPYTPKLKPVFDLPKRQEPTDHTAGIAGYGPGESTRRQDVLTELSVGQQLRLLAANDIDLVDKEGSGRGAMPAYCLGESGLQPAIRKGVRFRELTCRPDGGRRDQVAFSYNEFTSNLQRQTVSATKGGLGVPGIFKANVSFSSAYGTAQSTKKVEIHFQASQIVPKARVEFEQSDIELDPKLLDAIQNAATAEDLLGILKLYGHFVPLSIVLGGRITLLTSTELSDESQFEALESKLRAAADARFSVDGVPVEGGAGAGTGAWRKADATTIAQAKSLELDLKGGNVGLASSAPGTLGSKWIDSVGPFLQWGTIGFPDNALIPITEFLPGTLKTKVVGMLGDYLVSKLRVARTELAGSQVDDRYGPDDETLRRVRRITEIVVDHGENVDGLKWAFDFYPEAGRPSSGSVGYEDGIGRWRARRASSPRSNWPRTSALSRSRPDATRAAACASSPSAPTRAVTPTRASSAGPGRRAWSRASGRRASSASTASKPRSSTA